MATTTSKGIPIPQTTDNNAVVTDMSNLAQWVDDTLGPLTTTQRNALSAAAKWLGREIYNSTTKQKEWWDGAAWQVTGFVRGEIRWVSVDVTTPPVGWLACNGQAVSRTTYSDLDALYAAQTPARPYGAGNGSTTFNVPDLRGRGMVGLDNMGGAADAAVITTANTLGLQIGEEKHVLLEAEMAGHTHSGFTGVETATHVHAVDPPDTNVSTGGASPQTNTVTASGGVSGFIIGAAAGYGTAHVDIGSFNSATQSANHLHYITTDAGTGSGTAHNNMAPGLMLNAIVKY